MFGASVDSCQQNNGDCSPTPTAKRKIIPGTKFDLDLTLSPSSSLPDLSDLDGQQTPDDLDDIALSDLHDSELGDVPLHSVFGPALDWEGEILIIVTVKLVNKVLQFAASLIVMGTRIPHGSHCYLPPGGGDISAFTTAS